MEKQPITVQGLEKIKLELDERKQVLRPKIVAAISEARSHGDLKENAEYHAAKEEQGLNEKRIQELETSIALAEVIDITKIKADDKVIFASTIIVQDLEKEKKKILTKLWEEMRLMLKMVLFFLAHLWEKDSLEKIREI